ncbi:hypothetical protein LTR37_019485 [Vermiconidia calcicola]|uniref:Uncharacterized protein n=1 Tax=Vermiconidia calcicola TaxID=1690605 RepID=A0ACC3MFT8_9PEZI|nr:hypothetical protein LTR37_019485 [Vermiconidia calcicola]
MNIGGSLPPEEPPTIFYVGQHETARRSPVSLDLLSQAQSLGYDFLATQITTAAFQSRILSLVSEHSKSLQESSNSDATPAPLISPFTPQDTTLVPEDSNTSLVAIVSPWIDLGSTDPIIAHISRQVFNLEVAYAAFCGVNNIVVYGPLPAADVLQYARAIQEGLGLGPYLQLHILLPMTGELETEFDGDMHLSDLARGTQNLEYEEEPEDDLYGTWNAWNTIRALCSYSHKLSIALELPRQLPSLSLQSRWYSEPVRLLLFPRTTFIRNAKGYPVLSKAHQQLLTRFARLRFAPWMLLSDVGSIPDSNPNPASNPDPEPTPAEAASCAKEKPKDPVSRLRYLRYLQQSQPPRPPIERFGQGYQDYLQSPLQPLTDNLESITYEVFEKDPVKYEWYERAIAAALKDLSSTVEDQRPLIVAVVGAGRGPLTTRALQASQKTGIAVSCWAVEKNPNAFVLLQHRNATDPLWAGQVNIVKSDMRHWQGPIISGEMAKVDIIVSELLGSFADNELSPECLDGVQHVLHSDHGVSIPQSYSAHFTPISTPRLYGDLLSRSGSDKWDIPYVVMLHQYDYLSVQPDSDTARIPDIKEAWSFSHPIAPAKLEQSRRRAGGGVGADGWVGGDGSNEHNARSCKLSFRCQDEGVCHGLAGYFETVLYTGSSGKVQLSTNPVTMEEKSKDMISWFPIFFPLKSMSRMVQRW